MGYTQTVPLIVLTANYQNKVTSAFYANYVVPIHTLVTQGFPVAKSLCLLAIGQMESILRNTSPNEDAFYQRYV